MKFLNEVGILDSLPIKASSNTTMPKSIHIVC